MKNDKYVYFRTVGTIGDDDAQSDSCLFPLSSFSGMYAFSATWIILNFKNIHEHNINMSSANDYVIININSGTSESVMTAIMDEFSSGDNYCIVIGDDVEEEYLHASITSVDAITVAVSTD